MIAAMDIETVGLNAKAFRFGVVKTEKGEAKVFHKRKKMWEHIKELGRTEQLRGHRIYMYGHNIEYDIYGTVDLKDKELRYFSFNPFIAEYRNIQFVDTMGLFRGSLAKMGKTVELEKKNMEVELLTKEKLTMEEKAKMIDYCKRDVDIVLRGVKLVKERLREDGIGTRRILTAGQIAINYFTNSIRDKPYNKAILAENLKAIMWQDQKRGKYHDTRNADEVHAAYRGGRVQNWIVGTEQNVTYIDANSLYPWAATQIQFPDLRTEVLTKDPLKHFSKKELLKGIGVSKALIEKPGEDIGYIPVRDKELQVFPNQKCKLIGTWTHQELRDFVKKGAKIKAIERSVTYTKINDNPLKDFMKELYQKRVKGDQFRKDFYKILMNSVIGKFGQRNERLETEIDTVEKWHEYKEKGYEVRGAIGTNYRYVKVLDTKPAAWYAPIICANVTAKARITLNEALEKIGRGRLIYCDTDGILFTGKVPKTITIGKELGQWKVESEKSQALVYARKMYSLDGNIRVSGVSSTWLNKEDFEGRTINYKRMKTVRNSKDLEEVGTFESMTTNITGKIEQDKQRFEEQQTQKLFIDEKEKDITWFIEKGVI